VAAPAEQQAHRLDQERLPGAGLAGEHVEPGRELEEDVLHDREVADAQALEHGTKGYKLRRSLPCQPSLAARVAAQVRSGRRIRFTERRVRPNSIESPRSRVARSWPSSRTMPRCGPSSDMVTCAFAPTTSGRLARVCGHTGVTTSTSRSGATTGPP